MATAFTPLTLWADPPRNRFFLISEDHILPSGDLVLRTLTGREQRVDEAALPPFEVTEEQAKDWLKGEFGKILDTARGAVNRFVEKLRSGPGEPDRVADLREVLDRAEAIIALMIAAGRESEAAVDDLLSLA